LRVKPGTNEMAGFNKRGGQTRNVVRRCGLAQVTPGATAIHRYFQLHSDPCPRDSRRSAGRASTSAETFGSATVHTIKTNADISASAFSKASNGDLHANRQRNAGIGNDGCRDHLPWSRLPRPAAADLCVASPQAISWARRGMPRRRRITWIFATLTARTGTPSSIATAAAMPAA
jgi:hypothetical protein